MPLGKSGKHYMNPHVMRSHGDAPEEKQEHAPSHKPEHAAMGEKKHEITKREDGSYSSMHHGSEHAEHANFGEAVHHMASKMGEKCPHCGGDLDEQREGEYSGVESGGDALGDLYSQD